MPAAFAGHLYVVTVLLFVIGQLAPARFLVECAAVLAALDLFVAVTQASALARCISTILAISGLAIAVACRMQPADYLHGLTAMLAVLGVVISAQILSIPVRLGGYVDALLAGIGPAGAGRRSTFLVQMGSFVVGAFMLVGAIPAAFYALWPGSPEQARQDRRGTYRLLLPIMRGSGAAVIWTPVAGTVAVATAATGVPVARFLVVAVPAAIAAALVLMPRQPALEETRCSSPAKIAPHPAGQRNANVGVRRHGRKRLELAMALGALLIAVVVGDVLLHNRDRVCFIAAAIAVCAVAWAMLLDPRGCAAGLAGVPSQARALSDNVVTFVAAGFFGTAVARSGAVDAMARAVPALARYGLALPLVSGCVFMLAFVGVHPTVSISVIGPVAAAVGAARPELLTLALTCSGALAYLASPFSATSLMASSIAGRPVTEVSLKWNLKASLAIWAFILALLSACSAVTARAAALTARTAQAFPLWPPT